MNGMDMFARVRSIFYFSYGVSGWVGGFKKIWIGKNIGNYERAPKKN